MIIKNSRIPKLASIVIDVYAITLWPFVFIRDHGDEVTINHEKIHLRQQVELLILGFYLLYGFFWLKRYIKHRDKARAYYENPFEREAYTNDENLDYLSDRKVYTWLNYL